MEKFEGVLENGSILFINVTWCGHCKTARPIVNQLAAQTGSAVPVYDVNGDVWKQFLKTSLGPSAPKSYPTILYLARDGTVVEFEEERTLHNLIAFACLNAGQARGEIAACNAL